MLIALALAGATPPDTLAGVTLGEPIQRAGWRCTPDACSQAANVAGVGGEVTATLCGGTVRQVRFSRTLMQSGDVGVKTPEVERRLANAGLFIVGDIQFALSEAYLALANGMANAGWTSGEMSVRQGEPYISSTVFTALDGRSRALSTIIGTEVTSAGKATVVHLRLETETLACASGL